MIVTVIYKIINKVNGKIYIGQTTKTFKERFNRHMYDSLNYRIDTKFSRAIRKYGKDNFLGYVIDTANTKEELDQKECYWIKFYDAVNKGYNITDGAIDANTYKYKTADEMQTIKHKISISKLGGKNPNATSIKCKNIQTGQELFFDSIIDCVSYLNLPNHNIITRQCNHVTKCLYNKKWLFSYFNEDYISDYTIEKGNRKSKLILVLNLLTNESKQFQSFASAERYYGVKSKHFSSKAYKHGDQFIIDHKYKITILN